MKKTYYYTYKVQCTAVCWEDYYYLGKHVTTNLDDGLKVIYGQILTGSRLKTLVVPETV